MGGWLLNPWLFAAGGALVSVPILIHLLNKRRFRIIDWAAMDFLIEADQKNRRRIQLEELLLLALRCLAVLLTGLLVARPFLPSSLTRSWFASTKTERFVVVDDSASMGASEAGGSPIQRVRDRLREFVTSLVESGAGDSLTLVLTSKPTRPLISDLIVNGQTAGEILAAVEGLEASALRSRWPTACTEVRGLVSGRSDKINRVVYLLTDLRRNDWIGDASESDDERADAVIEAVKTLAADTAGCFVVDLAESAFDNLSIVGVAPEDKSLLSGVTTRFQVTVRNHSAAAVRGVPVRFVAGGSLPITATIESVPAGGTASVPFSYTFAAHDGSTGREPEPVEMTADLNPVPAGDALAADNIAWYAARIRAGIPALIVDGDPSSEFGHAETFFLQRALAPPGNVGSGILPDVVGDAEFETRPLDPYQVVYLCNVYHLSEARRRSLEEWVQAGGGLVLWPGGQIDERYYAEQLYRNGQGLLPRKLERVAGDESEKTWVSFSIDEPAHPAVKVFSGDASPLLESSKTFQWWHVNREPSPTDAPSSIVLSLTDPERSPALIDRPFGRGRVIQINVPADVEWSNWPEDASYLILLQELNRSLAQGSEERGQLLAGGLLEEPIDPAAFETATTVTRPDQSSVTRQAVQSATERAESGAAPWIVRYEDTDLRGFYRVERTARDGGKDAALFAVNLDPREGELQRVEPDLLRRGWEGSAVQLAASGELATLSAEGARGELWFGVLLTLIAILFLEQCLAWMFGRRR